MVLLFLLFCCTLVRSLEKVTRCANDGEIRFESWQRDRKDRVKSVRLKEANKTRPASSACLSIQESKSGKGKGAEDSAILQQALWDRDEAIEKWVHTLISLLDFRKKRKFEDTNYFGECVILSVPLCRKKAMEAELLRSKTEMMSLNNQLLEAVQKRLELSLELEAWKVNLRRI